MARCGLALWSIALVGVRVRHSQGVDRESKDERRDDHDLRPLSEINLVIELKGINGHDGRMLGPGRNNKALWACRAGQPPHQPLIDIFWSFFERPLLMCHGSKAVDVSCSTVSIVCGHNGSCLCVFQRLQIKVRNMAHGPLTLESGKS